MLHILTLTWQNIEKLSKLRESLLPALEGIEYQWVIKDNGSTDDTQQIVKDWGTSVKLIPYPNNLQNFSEGVNLCFKEANAKDQDYILLLNNDVIVNNKFSIKNMIDLMEKDRSIGVVGARLLFTDTNKIQHCGVTFYQFDKMPQHFRSKEESDKDTEKNRIFQAVTGAVLLTKAEYFKKVCTDNASGINGLDEKLRWAFDDIDLCLSIKNKLKKTIVYCGDTNFFHEESASLKKNPVNRLHMKYNVRYFKSKWSNLIVADNDIYEDSKHNLYKK